MSKITNKNIIYIVIYSLGILALLSLGITSPAVAHADNFNDGESVTVAQRNPRPYITSIGPKESNPESIPRSIVINGFSFVPASQARINGESRKTTFVDSRHLIVAVNPNDIYTVEGGFLVSVYNPAPGGGYSNGKAFRISNTAPVAQNPESNTDQNNTNTTYNYSRNVQKNTSETTVDEKSEAYKNLAATSIFGGKSIFPSGLIQWVLIAIIIILIVILIRKALGYRQNYLETPLKHS